MAKQAPIVYTKLMTTLGDSAELDYQCSVTSKCLVNHTHDMLLNDVTNKIEKHLSKHPEDRGWLHAVTIELTPKVIVRRCDELIED
jgi:hypothetical protein